MFIIVPQRKIRLQDYFCVSHKFWFHIFFIMEMNSNIQPSTWTYEWMAVRDYIKYKLRMILLCFFCWPSVPKCWTFLLASWLRMIKKVPHFCYCKLYEFFVVRACVSKRLPARRLPLMEAIVFLHYKTFTADRLLTFYTDFAWFK